MMVWLISVLVLPSLTWSADQSGVDEARLRELIKEVIKENPQLIYDTVNQYAMELQRIQQEKEFEASLQNRLNEPLKDYHPSKGPDDAPIVIVEYTDFECSYCARAAGIINQLLKKYPQQVRLVFRNNPLSMHENALPAAQAAMAAHKQGKFWPYHDLLFANMRDLNDGKLVELAGELKLDLDQFNSDRKSEAIAEQVEQDIAQAKINKFGGTPTFLVNGVVVRGARPEGYFSKLIDRLLAEKAKQ
jgi:protein-disulfide isomerase